MNQNLRPQPHQLTPAVEEPTISKHAVNLMAAYLTNPNTSVAVDQIPAVMNAIVEAVKIATGMSQPEPVKEELKPAVPIRKSVSNDYIICLEDGKKFKSLKRHLRTHYNLSPEEYREKWGLPADYPMVAPSYSATRSKLAKDNGLGTKKD